MLVFGFDPFPMPFKTVKLKKKRARELAKVVPVAKTYKMQPHDKKMAIMDVINKLFVAKKNMALRKILSLDNDDIEKNKVILGRKVLDLALEINFEAELITRVLKKLVLEGSGGLEDTLYEYLVVAILCNRNYKSYFMYCLKNIQRTIVKNREYLEEIIEDGSIKSILKKYNNKTDKFTFDDKVIMLGSEFLRL